MPSLCGRSSRITIGNSKQIKELPENFVELEPIVKKNLVQGMPPCQPMGAVIPATNDDKAGPFCDTAGPTPVPPPKNCILALPADLLSCCPHQTDQKFYYRLLAIDKGIWPIDPIGSSAKKTFMVSACVASHFPCVINHFSTNSPTVFRAASR